MTSAECTVCQVAHGEVMQSIDRAISKVEAKISQAGGQSTKELEKNLQCVLAVQFRYLLEVLLFIIIEI